MDQSNEAPSDWQGQLNFTYYIGPGFKDPYSSYNAYIEVNNYLETRNIVDVIGTIYGSQEPGESSTLSLQYMFGCHSIWFGGH